MREKRTAAWLPQGHARLTTARPEPTKSMLSAELHKPQKVQRSVKQVTAADSHLYYVAVNEVKLLFSFPFLGYQAPRSKHFELSAHVVLSHINQGQTCASAWN